MSLTNFRASDFSPSAVKAVPSKRDRSSDRREEPTPTTQPIVSANADPNEVPSGTVPEVLTWVGDDVDRAKKALTVELENSKPRKGLLEELNSMVDEENSDKS